MRMILIEIYENHWLLKKPMHPDKRWRNSRALPYMEQERASARAMDLFEGRVGAWRRSSLVRPDETQPRSALSRSFLRGFDLRLFCRGHARHDFRHLRP